MRYMAPGTPGEADCLIRLAVCLFIMFCTLMRASPMSKFGLLGILERLPVLRLVQRNRGSSRSQTAPMDVGRAALFLPS